MQEANAARLGAYKKVDVQTASQGKLIVLLFNGAIQRAEEAKRQMLNGTLEGVHNNLIRAQDIIGELRGALDMKTGLIATNLDRIYEYLQHLLITANVRKDPSPIDEAVGHMVSLRDTWQEVFSKIETEKDLAKAPPMNQHGASVMNLKG